MRLSHRLALALSLAASPALAGNDPPRHQLPPSAGSNLPVGLCDGETSIEVKGVKPGDQMTREQGQAERRRGLAGKLAAVSADPRNPLLITADPALLGDYGDGAIPLGGSRLGGFGGHGGGSRRNESGTRSATAR